LWFCLSLHILKAGEAHPSSLVTKNNHYTGARMDFQKALKQCMVKPGSRVCLKDYDPDDTAGCSNKKLASKTLSRNTEKLAELQRLLYAENLHALMIILQGMDASGKDGAIRQVMSGINPQGCTVVSFKSPSDEELDHDYLWRIHKAAPARGEIGIFNRSHYEDVLIVRVHNLVPPETWRKRYDQINRFEQNLSENGLKILKFFLHIDKDEQKARLEERIKDPSKVWKMNLDDIKERKLWNEYTAAYEDVLTKCSTPWAPWHIIPANKKWVRNILISQIVISSLESLHMHYPKPKFDPGKIKLD